MLPAGPAGTHYEAVSRVGSHGSQEPGLAVTLASRFGAAGLAPRVFLVQAKSDSSGVCEGDDTGGAKKICRLFSRWCCFIFELKGKTPTSYIRTLNVRISAKNHKLLEFFVSSEGLWGNAAGLTYSRCAGLAF